MKKLTTLFLAAAALAILPVGAATTGNVTVTGSIAQNLAIEVNAVNNSGLDLTVDATVHVANVIETSNSPTGYTVAISTDSSNTPPFEAAGTTALIGQDAGLNDSDSLLYTISYDGTAPSFSNGSDDALVDTVALADGSATKVLTVSYTGTAVFLPSGNYADTIYLEIAAK